MQDQTHGGSLQGKPYRKQYFLIVQQFVEYAGSRLWTQPVLDVNRSGLVGLEEHQKCLDSGVLLRASDHRRDHSDGIVTELDAHKTSDGLTLRLDDRRIDEPGVQFARDQIGGHSRHGGKHPQFVLQRPTQAALGREPLSDLSVNDTLPVGVAGGLDLRVLEVLR